ncbi:MAG: hypothetical protein LBS11_11285 [Oscillospiraceae bacterium]|nr:hypothetical protein [Oscillospiraceae bacterium]
MVLNKWTGVVLIVVLGMGCGLAKMAGAETAEPALPVVNMMTGENQAIADIFPDPEKVIAAMELIAITDMEMNGNSYMENREVTPLPLDRWEVDRFGVTVRYPIIQLSTLTGRPGAYQFYWYELEGLYDPEILGEEGFAIEPGTLPGVPVSLGDDLERLAIMYGGGKESDFTIDMQVYRFEDARFRGVSALTSRDDPVGTGLVKEIRAKRLDYDGARVGVSDERDVITKLGEPESRETIDADMAYYQLLPEGVVLWYDQGTARLGMLVGTDGIVALAILRGV